ncbi:MAG: hypothetical protein KDI68_15020 [Gammaproteobacteria bacterium]|nr:hypothetical protein [Gammaproteobacteria bacterium]
MPWLRGVQLLALLSLGALIVSCQHKDELPQAGLYDPAYLADPVQSATAEPPFRIEAGEQRYLIKPIQDYRLQGVVVSFHDADSWWDIYHHASWQDYLNTRDICVIWGGNITSGVYQAMTFENTTWTCWASWPDAHSGARFSMLQLSNNHLLTENPYINEQIKSAEIGDQVYLEGHLAAYANLQNGFTRGTSTRRDDTGNGACETIYVNRFEIVRKANRGWRLGYSITKAVLIVSLILLPILLLKTPVDNRH